jgi:hypothetical protein
MKQTSNIYVIFILMNILNNSVSTFCAPDALECTT